MKRHIGAVLTSFALAAALLAPAPSAAYGQLADPVAIEVGAFGEIAYVQYDGSGTTVAGEAPFRATGHATLVAVDRPYEFISVTGGATQLGPFEGMRIIRNLGHTTVATATLVGPDGDSMNIYSEVEWDTYFTEASGFFVITGGTGRFEGATGYGTESVGAFDPAIGARVLTWDGVIDS